MITKYHTHERTSFGSHCKHSQVYVMNFFQKNKKFVAKKTERKSTSKMSYSSNAYGYQRPSPMGYSLPDQGMMGSAGVYGGAQVVSFPGPAAAQLVAQSKPYYRCWDNNHKKWFYWEKDSNVTSWTEPPANVTLIDHETGSIVPRETPTPAARPQPAVPEPVNNAAPQAYAAARNVAPTQASPVVATNTSTAASVKPAQQQQSRFQPSLSGTINPNYSAGVSRYTQPGSSTQSGMSAAEKARLEEADRLIAEQLQKQLSMEAEQELVANCPLPGEAAKIAANQKKKFNFSKPTAAKTVKLPDEEDIADMAKHGFVVKKQKRKKAPASAAK